MLQSLWLTTALMSDAQSSEGCRVLKSQPASPAGILGEQLLEAGRRLVASWKGDRRGVDEVES